jgi:uncharacterized protein YjgD (DUF1641 family)
MENQEMVLERLDRLDAKITPLSESARAIGELREEMGPRVNELVHALIVELADVEADFQLEDLLYLTKKLMRNVKNLNFSLDQLKNIIDFAQTAEPLLKSTVPQLIFFLDELEQKGVFRLMSTGLGVLKKIGQVYTEEEMEQIGDGMVRLMGMLNKVTSPETLQLLESAAEIPAKIDLSKAEPASPITMLRALGDPDTRQGFGVLLELTRGLGVLKPDAA